MREWGSTDGAPLLYWHGLNPFGSLALTEAGPAWAERGLRVVAFAAPGVSEGEALPEAEAYRPSRLADAIIEAADELGLETFAFVGWSWGASIGVHLAARHPGRVARLVLLDAGHTDVPVDPAVSLDQLSTEMSGLHEGNRFWDPRAAAAALYGLLQEQPSSTHRALGAGSIPVLLVLAGRNDTVHEVERFRAAVPHAEVRTLDSGHDLLADAPDETIELVADWLQPYVDTSRG